MLSGLIGFPVATLFVAYVLEWFKRSDAEAKQREAERLTRERSGRMREIERQRRNEELLREWSEYGVPPPSLAELLASQTPNGGSPDVKASKDSQLRGAPDSD
jgi:hypothetical protein